MIHENIAERLYCDLKNRGMKIDKPLFVEHGAKIGQFPKSIQLVIFGMRGQYRFTIGPVVDLDIMPEGTFTNAYELLIEQILKYKRVKFISLVIPNKGCIVANLEEFVDVIGRYVQDYYHPLDDIFERWDILIQEIEE